MTIIIPFSEINGFTLSIGHKNKCIDFVFINLWPFRTSRKSSTAIVSFYLLSVIAHELQHIKILQDWYSGKTDNFGVIFSGWAASHVGGESFFNRIIRFYFSSKDASQLRKKRYDVSPIELICYQYGFHEAYQYCSDLLTKQEQEVAKTILNSIDFINKFIEIDYFTSKQAYNRFTHSLYYLQKKLKNNPECIHRYPQLSCIFAENGLLKSPVQVFSARDTQNNELLDRILIRMFITLSFDWHGIFLKNPHLYDHMCMLSNNYCAESIDYLKNIIIGEVFLSKSVLQDNAAMRIKNVATLNQLMTTYHMPRTSGSVIPLYYLDDFTRPLH